MKRLLFFFAIALPSLLLASGIYNPGSGTGGGGGSSALEVLFGVARTSPTATIKATSPDFTGSVSGSTITLTLSPTQSTINTFTSSVTVLNTAGVSFTGPIAGSSATFSSRISVSSNTVLPGTTFYQNGNVTLGTNSSLVTIPVLGANSLPVRTASDGTLTTGQVSLSVDVTSVLGVANGGTNNNTADDDAVLVGNNTTWQRKTLPACTDTGGNHLNYDNSSNTFSCGTTSSVSGGGSSFSLAVGTGTRFGSVGYIEPLTSTSTTRGILIFDSTTFRTDFVAGGTTYVTPLSSSFTLQGNAFNGASQLVQLNGSTQLPAVSGALVTNLNASNLASGTVPAAQMPALTGDITTSAGAVATTAAATQANIKTFTSSITVTGSGGEAVTYGLSVGTLTITGSTFTVVGTTFNVTGSSTTIGKVNFTDLDGITTDLNTTLTVQTTFYVCAKASGGTCVYNGDGGTVASTISDANNCTAKSSPCATIQGAVNKFKGKRISAIVTIQLANTAGTGTDCYQSTNTIINNPVTGAVPINSIQVPSGNILDQYPQSYVYILGDPVVSTNVMINGSNKTCSDITFGNTEAFLFDNTVVRINGVQTQGYGVGSRSGGARTFAADTFDFHQSVGYVENITCKGSSQVEFAGGACIGSWDHSFVMAGGTQTINNFGWVTASNQASFWTTDPFNSVTQNTVLNYSQNGLNANINQAAMGALYNSVIGLDHIEEVFTGTSTYTRALAFAHSTIFNTEGYDAQDCPGGFCTNITLNSANMTYDWADEGGFTDDTCANSGAFKCTIVTTPLVRAEADVEGVVRVDGSQPAGTNPDIMTEGGQVTQNNGGVIQFTRSAPMEFNDAAQTFVPLTAKVSGTALDIAEFKNSASTVVSSITVSGGFVGPSIIVSTANINGTTIIKPTIVSTYVAQVQAPDNVTVFNVDVTTPALTDFLLTISSRNATPLFGFQNTGHLISSGTTPSITMTGGTGVTLTPGSTDLNGSFTYGGVGTGACITFANAYADHAFCILASTTSAVSASSYNTTSSSFTFSGITGSTMTYHCFGGKGG